MGSELGRRMNMPLHRGLGFVTYRGSLSSED
jgi:hypothetical protein